MVHPTNSKEVNNLLPFITFDKHKFSSNFPRTKDQGWASTNSSQECPSNIGDAWKYNKNGKWPFL